MRTLARQAQHRHPLGVPGIHVGHVPAGSEARPRGIRQVEANRHRLPGRRAPARLQRGGHLGGEVAESGVARHRGGVAGAAPEQGVAACDEDDLAGAAALDDPASPGSAAARA